MEKYLEVLKKCPLFYDIADDDLLRMLTCLGAKVDFYDKKYTVFAEGKPVKYIGIVLSGSVQLVRMDYYGNRSIIGTAGRSEMFAESFACAKTGELPVSVIASEPSEIMLIDSSHILTTCHNGCGFHHKLIYNLMKSLADKTNEFHAKLEITSGRTTRERLMTYLMYMAKKTGSGSFDVPFDRQELADFLEVDRSGLSTEIGKMKKEGIILNRKNHFELL